MKNYTDKLGSHRGDHICCLGRGNLIASDSSPKVRCQSIATNCAHSMLNSSPYIKWFFFILSTLFCFYKQPVYEQFEPRNAICQATFSKQQHNFSDIPNMFSECLAV